MRPKDARGADPKHIAQVLVISATYRQTTVPD